MRQWETSDQARKRSLHSQRQPFPCQQDLCWERPLFKWFSSCTSAAVSEKDWWAFERQWAVGGSEEMQLCWGKMEKVWAESPRACVVSDRKKNPRLNMARCAGELLVPTLWHSENMFAIKLYARQSAEVLSKDGCLAAASEWGLYIYRGSR